jgi:class 3 adenylate cyclase/tetratricopeptide (TPR) repeat protein
MCAGALQAATAGATPALTEEPVAHGGPQGECRQLTVMFCDLVDSCVLAERLDPEGLQEVLRGYQEACARVVRRYAGHIAQYAGDGLLVYFGYPYAHENDAERAMQAGLEVVDALSRLNARLESLHGIRLAVRIGIHSGPVVVGSTGDLREKQMFGRTMNLAARVQSVAEPDSVVVSAATLHLVGGLFVTHALGTHALKGIAEPVPLHRVLRPTGARSRLDVAAAVGLTPFVGRQHELTLILDRWQQVTEGHGQVVLVSGEAGIGKSRLVRVLRDRLAAEPHLWLDAHCSPYHEHSAFYPVVELLERGVRLDRQAPPAEQTRELQRAIEAAGLPVDDVIPLFAALLAIPPDGQHPSVAPNAELQRRRTLEWLLEWLSHASAERPTVVVVEDLHWIDPSTRELLGMLVEQTPAAPLLVVVTARPSADVSWVGRSSVTHLTLQPLTRDQVDAMIEHIGDASALPAAVRRQVAAKTDGVPLFVEELTRAVIESGVGRTTANGQHTTHPASDVAIPSTLQDSLTARLDRLGPRKEVAQFAAVLGREFSYALLHAVVPADGAFLDEALRELVRAELVHQRGVPPHANYRFKHALVQEAAYRSLLKSRRQEAHARVVRALTEYFPERVAAEPEETARHCAGAGLVADAIMFYRLAGERAARGSAHAEAVGHLSKALDLVPMVPGGPDRSRIELALRVALGPPLIAIRGYGNVEVELTYERARALCETIDEASLLYEAVWGLANYYQSRSDLVTAQRLAEQLVTIAERENEAPLVAWAHLQLGATLYFRGELAESLGHLETAIAAHDPAARLPLPGAPDPGVAARAYAGIALWALGHPDRAAAMSRESVALARTCGDAFSLALALCFGCTTMQLRRELDAVRAWAEECIALATTQQFPVWLGYARVLLGWMLAHKGESERSVVEIQEGLGALAPTGTEVGASAGLMLLAEAQRVIGQAAEALGAVDAGLAFVERRGQGTWDAELHRLKGDVLLELGGNNAEAEAERCFLRALEVARRQQATTLELRAATSLARLLRGRGRGAEGRAVLDDVVRCLGEGSDTQDVRDAVALLGEA